MSESLYPKIRNYVERITKTSIGNENPNGFCFTTSVALSIYLNSLGIQNSIAEGKMNGIPHFWLNLNTSEGLIIDATIRQFNETHDPIYIGRTDLNEIAKQYKVENSNFNNWAESYGNWCNPDIDSNGNPRPAEFVKKITLHNILTVSALIFELEKLDDFIRSNATRSYLFKLFLNPIIHMLRRELQKDSDIIEFVKMRAANEFELLLSKLATGTTKKQ